MYYYSLYLIHGVLLQRNGKLVSLLEIVGINSMTCNTGDRGPGADCPTLEAAF